MNKVAVLGSTGSVGVQALAAMRLHPDRFRVWSLAAGANAALLEEQARVFRPSVALLAHPPKGYRPPEIQGVSWLLGERAASAMQGCNTVLNAIVGIEGLSVSMEAAHKGLRLCLANKESLVAGGDLLMRTVSESGAELLPVDSEHSAVFQCMQGRDEKPERIVLTASGGPFRTWTIGQMRGATPEQALRHPSWSMGKRITTDSATMVNKALEVVEAGYLFGACADDIDVLIHPASIVHSMVRYRDGAVIAQMGAPDMRVPILYALSYPERLETGALDIDFAACGPLTFDAPDFHRFPALKLGYEVLRAGGTAGAVFNAADEAAVAAFHQGKCGFLDIVDLCEGALESVPQTASPTLEHIYAADAAARAFVAARVAQGE